jgi:hypothetical protein
MRASISPLLAQLTYMGPRAGGILNPTAVEEGQGGFFFFIYLLGGGLRRIIV